MKVSWDDEIPNTWKVIKNVPNHQPEHDFFRGMGLVIYHTVLISYFFHSCLGVCYTDILGLSRAYPQKNIAVMQAFYGKEPILPSRKNRYSTKLTINSEEARRNVCSDLGFDLDEGPNIANANTVKLPEPSRE